MHKINYGTQNIFFEIRRAKRKTLAIEVHPDSSVHVVAPERSSMQDIEKKVAKRAKWIVNQQYYFEQFLPRTPERAYISGETHLYLGKSYVLKVRAGDLNQVKLKGGQLQVICKGEVSSDIVKKQLAHWYYRHAEKKFQTLLNQVYLMFKEYDLAKPEMEIRRMAKRWGSCNTIDKISINPEIIKAPTRCIEYVIAHEICHLVVPNHNKEFYATLTSIMPTWKKWKDILEKKMA